MACAGADGPVDVYDLVSGKRLAKYEVHSGDRYDLAFSPDRTRLATAGSDNAQRLWDPETFNSLLELPDHRSYIRGVARSPDSTMLVSVCADYPVRVRDSASRDQRYAQLLAQRALQDEARLEVESIARAHATPEEAMEALRRRWPGDPERHRAGLIVLARNQ